MKKKIFALLLALCILYCILFPAKMAQSAAHGLILWYSSILPTLLPLSIFSNIIIQSRLYDAFFSGLHRVFRYLLPVRPACVYPVIAGFLFGFPLGSKICADLYDAGKISAREAEVISCISNNFGPAFLINYMMGSIGSPHPLPVWAVLAACYAPPLLLGRAVLARMGKQPSFAQHKIPASRSQINFKIIDAGIMDGFTTMIKLAGYIMLFAMLADVLSGIPAGNAQVKCILIGSMEITNGIHAVSRLPGTFLQKYVLDTGLVCFGGVSGLFQTSSMLGSTGFRLKTYGLFKLGCSVLGMGLVTVLYTFLR